MNKTIISPPQMLGESLELPRGKAAPNRFLKSAMSEVLAGPDGRPNGKHFRLYETWSRGGTAVVITGNVMIDFRALGEPGNVIVEDESALPALTEWARYGTVGGNHLWMQINHPGRQAPLFLNKETVAPSPVPFGPELKAAFATPRELAVEEIEDLVRRYGRTAGLAKKAGFTGAQIHGAHGYLVSQFLSPHTNRRTDDWGGTAEKRRKFALEVYRAMRAEVGDDFPLSIKLNSADFQRGGFTEDESKEVVQALTDEGMDLIEISGGNYEAPAMVGVKAGTRRREAYFLEFAREVMDLVDIPIAVTGGFRTARGMAEAVAEGSTDMVGLARPLVVDPDMPLKILLHGASNYESPVKKMTTGFKEVDRMTMLDITWYENQLDRLGRGRPPSPGMGPWRSILETVWRGGVRFLRKRRAGK